MSGPTVAEQVATLREQGFVVVRGFAAANDGYHLTKAAITCALH